MAWKARIEFLHLAGPSFTAGAAINSPASLMASQTLTGSGVTPVRTVAAPAFDGGGAGQARITVLSGAVILAWGADPMAGEGGGLRLAVGERATLSLTTGQVVSIAESADTEVGVGVAAGEAHLGQVGGESAVAVASFARSAATTAYASGQLVANSVTAGSVTPMAFACARRAGGSGLVRRVRLSSSNPAATGAGLAMRLHLFKLAPASGVGDGGVFSGAVNGVAAVHLGYVDVALDTTFSDGAKGVGVPAAGSEIVFDTASGSASLYGLLEVRSAYSPLAGEAFTVALEVLRD